MLQGCFDASTIEELETAVESYKKLARMATPHTTQAKDLIRKLVQLRLKLLEAKVRLFSYESLIVAIWKSFGKI